MNTSAPAPSRSVSREITIDAPVERVWNALTDPRELARWFPREAKVTPGVGGSIWRGWPDSPGIEERIDVWAPGVALRTSGLTIEWAGIVTDYRLTGQGGSTVLRVVSSGFGGDTSWDDLVAGFGSGWEFELLGLQHYLEHHLGTDRVAAWIRVPYRGAASEVWNRLVGPDGWFGVDGATNLRPGDSYRTTTSTGHELSGLIRQSKPEEQLVATVANWNDGLLRIHLFGGMAWIRLSTYAVPEAQVTELERVWHAAVAARLEPLG